MNYRVDDRVKVVTHRSVFLGKEGRVVGVARDGVVRVQLDGDALAPMRFKPGEIRPVVTADDVPPITVKHRGRAIRGGERS